MSDSQRVTTTLLVLLVVLHRFFLQVKRRSIYVEQQRLSPFRVDTPSLPHEQHFTRYKREETKCFETHFPANLP